MMQFCSQNDVPLFANYANAFQLSGTSHESKFLRFCRVSFEVRQDCSAQAKAGCLPAKFHASLKVVSPKAVVKGVSFSTCSF